MKAQSLPSEIPVYLSTYITKQDSSLYTAIDHASWRFILKVSQAFFAKYAHQKYLDGLKETGISTDRIPLIEEMDQCLRKFGWQAVAVTGFIPPAVFMEFLSLGILPIACDMRSLEHLSYTPAPDIVHEAAGHAPIIADPEYADYLKSYGEISKKAIFSLQDMNVYKAIRHLSDTKENPLSTSDEIKNAEKALELAVSSVTYISEATLLSRMGWWTFEYGLVGDLSDPKIFGAGLLSSLGESFHCFDARVKKIPFSVRCIETSYDITQPQPQLFVASNFQTLKSALKELENTMAFRRGGEEGLNKALQAETTTTTELDSGIQISGVLTRVLRTDSGVPCYLQFQGPTQISYRNDEIQSAAYHREGFGTPLVHLTRSDLVRAGFIENNRGKIVLDSGVVIEGRKVDELIREGRILIVTFEDCEVKLGSEVLFRPEWGRFDMVCGEQVVSVFGGAADRKNYLAATGGFHQEPGKQKSNLTAKNRTLNELYSKVRNIRDLNQWDQSTWKKLSEIHEKLEEIDSTDWLLRFELLELAVLNSATLPWIKTLRERLAEISKGSPEKAEMIQRGLDLLKKL